MFFGLFSNPGRIIVYPDVIPESGSLRWWSWDQVDEAALVETHWDLLRAVRSGTGLFVD